MEMKLNVDGFAEQLAERIRAKMGAGYVVSVIERPKINKQMQKGITIKGPDDAMAPVVYVNGLYERYQQGEDPDHLAEDVCAVYHEPKPFLPPDIRKITAWEEVKEHLRLILVPTESNRELLQQAVHKEILDLSVMVYLDVTESEDAIGCVTVREEMLKLWAQDREVVYETARENTLRSEWNLRDMSELIRELAQQSDFPVMDMMLDATPKGHMNVLTNRRNSYGAVYMVFPEVMDQIVEKQGDVYILPSSVHEIILLDEDEMYRPVELQRLVVDVNSGQVLPEEVLSDHVYRYSREKGLEIAA